MEDRRPNYPSVEYKGQLLTTNQGLVIKDDTNSLKFGDRGPILIEDHIFREKLTHFDHERIPERVVHARGSGAHGYFVSYNDWGGITKANFLNQAGKKTPVFVRFSQVIGFRGSSDMVRDVRGFAVKFYTEEGNFDLVANNIPVFFIQDPIKFPDVIHAAQPEPHNQMPQATAAHDNFWDFVSLTPETAHMLMWLLSPIGVPSSYRKMDGAGVNTFKAINRDNHVRLIKLHLKSLQGLEGMQWKKVQEISGKDPDYLRRDLWEAIDRGGYPEWELAIQTMEIEDELKHVFDPLDPTKIWPESQFPMIRLGKLILNRNPDNFFAEVEQVAFHPGHLVPGFDFSDDPILQGRLFSYLDTQLLRVGPNFHEIPINRALAPVNNNQQDGKARINIRKGVTNYHPNTRSRGCPYSMIDLNNPNGFETFSAPKMGYKVRQRSDKFNDHFSQATTRWLSLPNWEQDHIVESFLYELGGVGESQIIRSVIDNILVNIHPDLARRVESSLVKRFNENGHRINETDDSEGRLPGITHHHI